MFALVIALPVAAGSQGKTQLPEIKKFASFAGFFNLGRGAVRVVAIVDPSDESSAQSVRELCTVFGNISSKRFRGYVVLTPSDSTADQSIAKGISCPDMRLAFLWDAKGLVRSEFSDHIGEEKIAFLFFNANVTTSDEARAPHFVRYGKNASTDNVAAADVQERVADLITAIEQQARESETSDG